MFFWNRKKEPKTLRSRLRSVGIIVAIASALQISMPEWLTSLIGVVSGNAAPAVAPAGGDTTASGGGFLSRLYDRVVGGADAAADGNVAPPNRGGATSSRSDAVPGRGGAVPNGSGMVPGGGNAVSGGSGAAQSHRPPANFTGGTSTAAPARLSPQVFAAFANLRLRQGDAERLQDSPPPLTAKPNNAPWRKVDRVLDGDTIIVDGNQVKLLGIDCPEAAESEKLRQDLAFCGLNQPADMVALGRAAHAFTRQVAEGRSCWLEFDQRTQDEQGRYLAYVHLDDGSNLNETVLYSGYAKTTTAMGFRYMKRYIYLQNEAMHQRHGLWGDR